MEKNYPPITIGIVTYPSRAKALEKLLQFLAVSIERYPAPVSIRIGNNGGPGDASENVQATINGSPMVEMVDCLVLDSPENNIAVGRNLVVENTTTRLLAFIDDDEYPRENWILELVNGWQSLGCTIVAGPIVPVYEPGTPAWVKSLDLHNSEGKITGDFIDTASSGNFLVDLEQVGEFRFDPRYGNIGGSDTELFLRLTGPGQCTIRWVAEAIVDEDVPLKRSSSFYMMKRYTTQGAVYRKILFERSKGRLFPLQFRLQSLRKFVWAALLAPPLLLASHPRAGYWVKNACFNLGIISRPMGRRPLYRER